MTLKQILTVTESCMVVSIYDSKIEKVIFVGRVDKVSKVCDSQLEREVYSINHSEADDEYDIELVL